MAIAPREWIAHYPPLCGGSNGEREGILSVMVMMHFEWIVLIIYPWMIMAGESILWVMVLTPRKQERSFQSIQSAAWRWCGDELNGGSGRVFSVCYNNRGTAHVCKEHEYPGWERQ